MTEKHTPEPPATSPSETAAIAGDLAPDVLERLIVGGDLSKLTPPQRVAYYLHRCRQVGLDPSAQPFQYLVLNKRLVLYATKAATDQLTGVHRLSTQIVAREMVDDAYVVTARVTSPDGRVTEEIGAVSVERLKGDARCNAMMKAHTKAKRRAILAHLGLGMLDETEVETVPDARRVPIAEAQQAPPSTTVETPTLDVSLPQNQRPRQETPTDDAVVAQETQKALADVRRLLDMIGEPASDPVVLEIFRRHDVHIPDQKYTVTSLRAVARDLETYIDGGMTNA